MLGVLNFSCERHKQTTFPLNTQLWFRLFVSRSPSSASVEGPAFCLRSLARVWGLGEGFLSANRFSTCLRAKLKQNPQFETDPLRIWLQPRRGGQICRGGRKLGRTRIPWWSGFLVRSYFDLWVLLGQGVHFLSEIFVLRVSGPGAMALRKSAKVEQGPRFHMLNWARGFLKECRIQILVKQLIGLVSFPMSGSSRVLNWFMGAQE